MRAIQQRAFGGPEVLELVELPDPVPGPGELVVDVTLAGVNFADTHQRRNEYLEARELPFVPGTEVVGRRAGTGERVVALTGTGGYAERALAREDRAFPVPDDVPDDVALALLVQGLTAWHLLRTSARLAEGESVVVVGGAGGTGGLAVQLAKGLGAGRVVATASSEDKRAHALALGADEAVDGDAEGLADRLLAANGGAPVDVVLEMAGGPVFDACFEALAPFGRLVTYGISGGTGNRLHTRKLMAKSASLVGFWVFDLLERPRLLRDPLADLLARAGRGELQPAARTAYGLSEAARAQEDLAGRRTTGKVVLDVSR